MKKLSRNPRKTNKQKRSLYSMSESKKSQQSPLTPSSMHFLKSLHSNHTKGTSSLHWAANHPEDDGAPLHSWEVESSPFYWVEWILILSMRPNRTYLIPFTWQSPSVWNLVLMHSANICCVRTMWRQSPTPTRIFSVVNTLVPQTSLIGNSSIPFTILGFLLKRGIFVLLKYIAQNQIQS